jgi:hypothetical protein
LEKETHMKLPNNAPFWLQLFVAGFSACVASSLVLTAIYFAKLDDDVGPVVAIATFFVMAGFGIALSSLAAILIIGARRLCSVFGRRTISA